MSDGALPPKAYWPVSPIYRTEVEWLNRRAGVRGLRVYYVECAGDPRVDEHLSRLLASETRTRDERPPDVVLQRLEVLLAEHGIAPYENGDVVEWHRAAYTR